MVEAAAQTRWVRRLLLLAAAVCGLWLLGLLSQAGQAHADPQLRPGAAPSALAARHPIADALQAARPAVSAIVNKTVSPAIAPVRRPTQTVLVGTSSSVQPVVNRVIAPIVNRVVTPVGRVVTPVVTPVVQEIVTPVVDGVVTPVVQTVRPVVAPILIGVIAPVLGPVLAPVLGSVSPLPLPMPLPSLPINSLGPNSAGSLVSLALVAPVLGAAGSTARSFTAPTSSPVAGFVTAAAAPIRVALHRPAAPTAPTRLPMPAPDQPEPGAVISATVAAGSTQPAPSFEAIGLESGSQSTQGNTQRGEAGTTAPREQAFSPSVSPD